MGVHFSRQGRKGQQIRKINATSKVQKAYEPTQEAKNSEAPSGLEGQVPTMNANVSEVPSLPSSFCHQGVQGLQRQRSPSAESRGSKASKGSKGSKSSKASKGSTASGRSFLEDLASTISRPSNRKAMATAHMGVQWDSEDKRHGPPQPAKVKDLVPRSTLGRL